MQSGRTGRRRRVSGIRLATDSDAAALAALRYELRYEFRASHGTAEESRDSFIARARDWMASRLAAPTSPWRCWVAMTDDGVAGQVWLQRVEKIPNPVGEPEAHAYITNLYVRPALRGRGVGGALLASALQWGAENGVDAAFLWPTPESRSLYARHGFAASAGLMQRRPCV
jgi:GNAT superfamily N-acetyltransferase